MTWIIDYRELQAARDMSKLSLDWLSFLEIYLSIYVYNKCN
jgi:hypothetical protein